MVVEMYGDPTDITLRAAAAAAADRAVPGAGHKVAGRASTCPRGGPVRAARSAPTANTIRCLHHRNSPTGKPAAPPAPRRHRTRTAGSWGHLLTETCFLEHGSPL